MTGMRLISIFIGKQQFQEAERIAELLAGDPYMDGVAASPRLTARDVAERKLQELRFTQVGQTLPEVGGETLEGVSATISDYRGKVVVLDVWATWCGPCVAMIPHQRELVERLKDQPFALLSVSCDDDAETVVEYQKSNPMPWDHWWVGTEGDFTKLLAIGRYPSVFVLDKEGVIRFKDIKGPELDAAVNSLLGIEEAGEPDAGGDGATDPPAGS